MLGKRKGVQVPLAESEKSSKKEGTGTALTLTETFSRKETSNVTPYLRSPTTPYANKKTRPTPVLARGPRGEKK